MAVSLGSKSFSARVSDIHTLSKLVVGISLWGNRRQPLPRASSLPLARPSSQSRADLREPRPIVFASAVNARCCIRRAGHGRAPPAAQTAFLIGSARAHMRLRAG